MPDVVFPLDSTKPFTDQKIVGHNRWHPDIPAAVHVKPGQSFRVDCREWFDGAGNFMGSTVVVLGGGGPPPASLSFVAALAVREQAASLFRGAGYLAFGTPANPTAPSPANALQSAIGAPYAHTTAPLRRLVDRFVLTICHALANGLDVPAWARDALPDLPAIMTRTSQLASALDRGAVDRVEAAVLSARIGETFDAIVLSRRGETTSARVRLVDPPVEAEVVTAAPAGSRIRVRAAQASIPDGTVALAEVAP